MVSGQSPRSSSTRDKQSHQNAISADALDRHSSLSTPPPGFDLLDARFHGEKLSRSRAAAASAPPTSLFANGGADFESLFGIAIGEDGRPPRMMQRPATSTRGRSSDGITSIVDEDEDTTFTKSRTMSYNNLVLALGEGLAECMGDSLNESEHRLRNDFLLGNER